MMWFRRLLTIPLIILFVILFITVLLITQINGTFSNPEFYNEQLQKADVYNFVYDKLVPAALDEVNTESSDFHIDVQAIQGDVAAAARKIVPPEWLQAEVESATNTIIPYMMGSTDSFTYTVALKDKAAKASEVIKSDIIGGPAFPSLYDDGIAYATDRVAQNLDMLPYSLTFSRTEIENSLKEAIPQDWAASQAKAAVDFITPYMTGDSDHFAIIIPLKEQVDEAESILTGLADQKIEAKFNSLPTCSMAEFNQAVQGLPPGSLPRCRPYSLSYQGFKDALNIDTSVTNSIRQMVSAKIPDQWSYTDADLVKKLGSDNSQTLDDARGWIKNGYTLTETDLRDKISDTDEDLNSFDTVRHRIDSTRAWVWTLWLIPFAFLVFIGLLGGRNWRSKLAWGLTVLFVTSLAICICTSVVYSHVGEPRLETGWLDLTQYHGVGAVIAEKGNEVIHNIIGAFASGIKDYTLYFTIGSGVILLGLFIWRVILPRTQPTAPRGEPPQEAV
jgi:hypothetical protein